MITAWISADASHELSLGSKIGDICEFVVVNRRNGKIFLDIIGHDSAPGTIRARLGPPTTNILGIWQYVKNPKRPVFSWVWDESLQMNVWTMIDEGEEYVQCQPIPGFSLKLIDYLDVAPDLIDADGNTFRPAGFEQTHNWAGWADKAPN